MKTQKQKAKEFSEVSKPLMQWLNENCHPHVTVIVTPTDAELLEGIISTGQIDEFLKD